MEEERAENEKLQAQVAMLRETLTYFTSIYFEIRHRELAGNALQQTESDWLTQHDQQVRDEAYDKAMNTAYDHDCRIYSNESLAEVVCMEVGDKISNLKGT